MRSSPSAVLLTGEDVATAPWYADLGWVLGEITELGAFHGGADPAAWARLADALFQGYGRALEPECNTAAVLRITLHLHDFLCYVAWSDAECIRYADLLRVLVDEQPGCARVAVSVHYGVGFRTEPRGWEGFAHLFEHLMFRGSHNLPRGRFFDHVYAAAGQAGGTTHQDYTEYFQIVPSDALGHALFSEADRMRAPVFTPGSIAEQLAGRRRRPARAAGRRRRATAATGPVGLLYRAGRRPHRRGARPRAA